MKPIKISNLQIVLTDEVKNRKWAEIIGRRNKLLMNSDWTQLSDSKISILEKKKWSKWRDLLRAIKRPRFLNYQDAYEELIEIERHSPGTVHIEDSPKDSYSEIVNNNISRLEGEIEILHNKVADLSETSLVLSDNLEEAKTQVKKVLRENYITVYNNKFALEDIEKEKFDQAVELLTTSNISTLEINDYPLIKIYSEKLNTTPQYVANMFLQKRKEWMKNICNLEGMYLQYDIDVDAATSAETLKTILQGITV